MVSISVRRHCISSMTLMLMDHLWATLLPAKGEHLCRKSGLSHFRLYGSRGDTFTHGTFKSICFGCCCLQCFRRVPFDPDVRWYLVLSSSSKCALDISAGSFGYSSDGTGAEERKKSRQICWCRWLSWQQDWYLGTLCMVDYYGVGVVTVFVFYFFHGRKCWVLLGQLICPVLAECGSAGRSDHIRFQLLGMEFELCQRGLAFWHWFLSGCIAANRVITANHSSTSAMHFIRSTCCCLWQCC